MSRARQLTGLLLLALSASACDSNTGPGSDKQTNWLRACEIDSQCGASMRCRCGACTRTCDSEASCQGLSGSSCVPATDRGSIALCGGDESSDPGLCLPSCADSPCNTGQMCVAGKCQPLPMATAHVAIDTTVHHQTLTGFGATVGYAEDAITHHPQKAALYRAMFADLGLDVLRFRNRYGYAGADDLSSASEIATQATISLGRPATLLLTSWSPPATLKANASQTCQGNFDTCTLVQAPGGGFDYASYANYWRSSLDAYAELGFAPDYIGIQNNPDWVPSSVEIFEACKFLPKEGTQTTTVNGVELQVRYPGYDEALSAVVGELAGLSVQPKIVAPEVTAAGLVAGYIENLDLSHVDAIGHHLYGTDPTTLDPTASLRALQTLGQHSARPLFQTEMQADGFGTALLLHDTLVLEGAALYVQTSLIGPAASPGLDPTALITLGASDYTLEAPYYAVRQYSAFTDPGWVRVEAPSDAPELLSSGWSSPDGTALTVVVLNVGRTSIATELELGAFDTSRVIRTVFDGVERTQELGPLPIENIVQVPGRSIVTVTLTR